MARKIRLDLSQFKSSGVYTLEFDGSESIVVQPQTIKLVVGFSRQGPFNTLVFLDDPKNVSKIYGDIDPYLERKGSFFHRSLVTALQTGPCFALNLLKLNNDENSSEVDKISYKSFSVDSTEENGILTDRLYSSFYNKSKFWSPDTEYFIATRDIDDQPKILNFTNLGKNPLSIIVKKSPVKGYDITAKEWFGVGKVPAYMRDFDYIKDYFIEVLAVEGDFGPTRYAALAIDPIFSEFFDASGLKKDKLDDFLNLPDITFAAKFVGTIIPDFIDGNGVNQFIETIINNNVSTTGLFCSINKEALDDIETNDSKVDLLGHNLIAALADEDLDSIDFLSYKSSLKQDFTYTNTAFTATELEDGDVTVVSTGTGDYTISIADVTTTYPTLVDSIKEGQSVIATSAGLKPIESQYNPSTDVLLITVDVAHNTTTDGAGSIEMSTGSSDEYVLYLTPNKTAVNAAGTDYLVGYEYSTLFTDFASGKITNGDRIVWNNASVETPMYLKFVVTADADGITIIEVKGYSDAALTTQVDLNFSLSTYTTAGVIENSGTSINVQSLIGTLNDRVDVTTTATANKVIVSNTDSAQLSVGDYLVSDAGTDHLTRILSISKNTTSDVIVTTQEKIKIFAGDQIERFKPVESFVDHLDFTHLAGFELKARHMPNNTNDRMKEILHVMTDTNIYDSLIDSNIVTFRYIVDTFNHGLEPQSKAILAKLAKDRGKALAILNTPSIKEFQDSIDPRFTEAVSASEPKPLLNTKYIVDGGNLDLNPSFTYSLPDEVNGAKYCGFFGPNFIIKDGARRISVPPAAYVSNLFVQKFINGTPFAIVAGKKRGIIADPSIEKLEYDFLQKDRDNLEPFGINPIINRKGQILVFSNQTGFQKTNSALNNLHVRDLLITLEEDVEGILTDYLFEFNDATVRLEITKVIESYMEKVVSDGGIQNFDVIMDRSNNTDEVINQNSAIIDIRVEPSRGIQKFISRFTISKAGGVQAGGFANV